MKKFICFIILAALTNKSFSQTTNSTFSDSFIRKSYILQRMVNSSGMNATMIPGIPMPPPETVGDVYLHKEYRKATFMLYENEMLVEGYTARYDLQRNEFDLMTQQGVRVLPGKLVKNLVWLDSVTQAPEYMFNYSHIKNKDGVPYVGFFQLIVEGKVPLLKKTEVILKRADYDPRLGVGSQANRYLKKPHFYIVSGEEMIEISSKKDLQSLPNLPPEWVEYVKRAKPDPKNENSVIAAITFLNTL